MKALIIRLTSLGDVIFTVPLANVLKDNGCEVGWLVAEKGLDVVKGNPAVDKMFFVPLKQWKKRPFSLKTFKEFLNLIKEIRKEEYDVALDCQQMFKSLLLFAFCGAKRRITLKGAKELSFLGANELMTSNQTHIVERNLDFASHLGLKANYVKFSLPENSATCDALNDLKPPIVVISPATTWENKHWSEENWKELIEQLKDRATLVFTGMECDKPLISRIGGDDFLNLAGKTNVEELKAVFAKANLVISPDSGSAHLAWASSNPAVIAIFTCTPPKRFGPYGQEKYFSISSELPCQPCFKKKCKYKHQNCTNFPTAEEVINIVNRVL